MSTVRAAPQFSFLFLVLLVTTLAVRGSLHVYGDGLEYIIQTQSLVFDQSLKINPDERRKYWNQTNPFSRNLGAIKNKNYKLSQDAQVGGGFGGLYPDKNGDFRYYHFWTYSLLAAPIYLLLHIFSANEYYAFKILNVIALLIPFLLVFMRKKTCGSLALFGLLIISPLIAYTDWQHPELLLFALVFCSFYLTKSKRFAALGPVLLGIAASQNVPILLLFPAQAFLWVRQSNTKLSNMLVSYVIGALLGMSSIVYYYIHFGTPSLISAIGQASLEFASIDRVMSLVSGPMLGAFWTMPACFLFLLFCFGHSRNTEILLSITCIFAAAWLCSSTVNLNSGHVGVSRYMIWLLAPLIYFVCDTKYSKTVLVATSAICLLFVWHFRTWELALKQDTRFLHYNRAQPEIARLYKTLDLRDDLEVMVENIRGSELPNESDFNGIYIWNLGGDNSLWVVSKSAIGALDYFWFTPGSKNLPSPQYFFKRKKNLLRLRWKKINPLNKHPVFGDYAIFRASTAVADIHTNVPVYLKGS